MDPVYHLLSGEHAKREAGQRFERYSLGGKA
jgi:hypothetical protein